MPVVTHHRGNETFSVELDMLTPEVRSMFSRKNIRKIPIATLRVIQFAANQRLQAKQAFEARHTKPAAPNIVTEDPFPVAKPSFDLGVDLNSKSSPKPKAASRKRKVPTKTTFKMPTKQSCAEQGKFRRRAVVYNTKNGEKGYRKPTCVKKKGGYTVKAMRAFLKDRGVKGYSKMSKAELSQRIHSM